MEFFDIISNTISKGSKDIANKAKEIADVVKLNSQINSEEEKIRNAYYEIGKMYYELHKDDIENEFEDKFEAISNAHMAIAKCKLDIQEIKGIRTCTNCGAEMATDAVYCSACGYKNEIVEPSPENETEENTMETEEEPVEETVETVRYCSVCNAQVTEGTAFCEKCGEPIDK
ncbi:MAG: zinc-ribbon domain-containing protein [Lachnospiraceae bacterium]